MSGTRHSPHPPHRSRGRHHSDDLQYDYTYDRDDSDGYDRAYRKRRESRARESKTRRSGYRGVHAEDEGVHAPDEDDVFDDRRHRSRKREHQPSRDRRHRDRVRTRDERVTWDSATESEDIVDSRPIFARPPNASHSPRADRRERDRDRERHSHYPSPRSGHKAKESPATSPKKRDRERDREGHNRHRPRRDSTADEGGDKRLRDRRRRGYDTDQEREYNDRDTRRHGRREKHTSNDSANSATVLLNSDALAQLDQLNRKADEDMKKKARKEEIKQQKKEKKKKKYIFESGFAGDSEKEREKGWESPGDVQRKKRREKDREKEKKRLVSGAYLEEGRSPELRTRGGGRRRTEKYHGGGGGGGDDYYFSDGYDYEEEGSSGNGCLQNWSKRKKIVVVVGVCLLLLAIIIAVAVLVSKKNAGGGKHPDGPVTTGPSHSELDGISPNSIPSDAKGTHLDPFSWYDTADFNVTYTDETVGGLPIMGLNSTWDDSAQANEKVPALDKPFPYGKQPIRGVNLGGWLSMEPFITPSFFQRYSARDNVVDEYTLTKRLGNAGKPTLEKHYATFVNEQTFKEIRDAGFDHVRIPYGYWVVTTYDGDPYFAKMGWRYLLRAIEYCRKFGLRVNLDLHGVPGSQNGWNHSGRQGEIKWLKGDDGAKWGQRALDLHDQLSKFFAQPRYKNVIALYGLANEPMMLKLDIEPVLDWTTKAADIVGGNGMKQKIVFGDGFLKLSKWSSILQNTGHDLIIDTHQYTIFNADLIKLTHKKKLEFVCDSWVDLITKSSTKGSGYGPTICGEWSQADTDCTIYINSVGVGSRWTGTMDKNPIGGDPVLTPSCPSGKQCSCDAANADPSQYSDSYKKWLRLYAEAQISAFEKGWGWFYWTWDSESAAQWSWKKGMAAGILPSKAYEPEFKCGDDIPDFGDLPENY
ncbi:glucan 1,3-beta-glucosidase [Trichophyton mentagrophytes]|nr:glucan 1,3-beta-glucosidase [Trichophyton mentagrophytes]